MATRPDDPSSGIGPSEASTLTDEERVILNEIGPAEPDEGTAIATRIRQTSERRAEFVKLLRSSLGVAEVAEVANVTRARIRQRLNADRSLWGFKDGSAWRIPAWQLDGTGVLSGVDKVAAVIPTAMNPVSVARMLTLPNPDLVLDGNRVSVIDWLRAGGDPDRAAHSIGSPADLV